MRFSRAIIALATCSLLQVAARAAVTITWGNDVGSLNLSSDPASVPWAPHFNGTSGFNGYTYRMGTFTDGYTPSAANATTWATNFNSLSSGNYNSGTGQFAGSASIDAGNAYAGDQAYIWVSKAPDASKFDFTGSAGTPLFGSEWLLVKDLSWTIPNIVVDANNPGQAQTPLQWDLHCNNPDASNIIFGGVGGVQGAGDYLAPALGGENAWCLQSHAYTTINPGEKVTLKPNGAIAGDSSCLLGGLPSWNLTLNGGNFSTGGLSDSAGVFSLTGNATAVIDFADSSSLLRFASTNTSQWNGRLEIWNWTGNLYSGAGGNQLAFNNFSGPDYFTGDRVQFYSDNGMTPRGYGAAMVGNLECGYTLTAITAIPEASSVAAVLALLGLIGWRERRYFTRSPEARARAATF